MVHPLTAPVLGNDHKEFRGRENPVSEPQSSSNFFRCDMKYLFTACNGLVIKFACDSDIYIEDIVKSCFLSIIGSMKHKF